MSVTEPRLRLALAEHADVVPALAMWIDTLVFALRDAHTSDQAYVPEDCERVGCSKCALIAFWTPAEPTDQESSGDKASNDT